MYLSPQETSMSPMGFSMPGLSMGDDNLGDETIGNASNSGLFNGSQWPGNGDNVALTVPPFMNDDNASSNNSSLSSMFAPLFTAIGSLFSQMSQMFPGTSAIQNSPNLANCTQIGQGNGTQIGQGNGTQIGQGNGTQQQAFQTATASSTGDPHLAFNGTSANGTTASDHWDNMNSHGDLLDSNSFRGGYKISTQATQPNANGVTYNQNATVSMNGGNVAVSLDAGGNATISENGNVTSLQDGQSMNLGRGESVTRNANGSLVVNDQNRQGGSIATTLSGNGSGVDVNVHANNVNLGGYMVNTAEGGNWRQ